MEGIVTRSTGSWYTVRLSDGNRIECRLRGKIRLKGMRTTNPVAVGDNVKIERGKNSTDSFITALMPRKNYIIRKATKLSKSAHIIAANLHEVWIMASLAFPRTSRGFIDRLLITAEAYHIPAAILFNKIDIYDSTLMRSLHHVTQLYTNIGYKCYHLSALAGTGVDELRNELAGKIVVISGHSGVGKSQLLNALDPSLNLKTSELSLYHERGKHTTTFSELFELKNGGMIIDTPGIGEFSLTNFDRKEVWERFPEMRAVSNGCRFNNCTHILEPGCAVKIALHDGRISPERYESYLS
ncbi:MAG TPA: ribosome small subunit-dependent GTPase A, partial [Bacteroidales bacterium]|nr:ribosome small subunit-dependent GTPase A [Bacteroidales bacterium]